MADAEVSRVRNLPSPRRTDAPHVDEPSQNGSGARSLSKGRRVNVNFAPAAYDSLRWLAKIRGVSLSDALRDAIALARWFEETRREGGRILVERDGQLRELIRI